MKKTWYVTAAVSLLAVFSGCYNDFGIKIEYIQKEPVPIDVYQFTKNKENDRIVPRIIFVALDYHLRQ
jgi:hypothetical protein